MFVVQTLSRMPTKVCACARMGIVSVVASVKLVLQVHFDWEVILSMEMQRPVKLVLRKPSVVQRQLRARHGRTRLVQQVNTLLVQAVVRMECVPHAMLVPFNPMRTVLLPLVVPVWMATLVLVPPVVPLGPVRVRQVSVSQLVQAQATHPAPHAMRERFNQTRTVPLPLVIRVERESTSPPPVPPLVWSAPLVRTPT